MASSLSVGSSQLITRTIFLFFYFIFFVIEPLSALSLAEEFEQNGYTEICDETKGAADFNSLYASFDTLIDFLQRNPAAAQKLYAAKERFIRLKERDYYSTNFFGFYDESKKKERNQISFYYSIHFHEFISSHYPNLSEIPEITCFFEACLSIQKPYGYLFKETAHELGLETIFSSKDNEPPLLLKVIKYLPSYNVKKPHYDGTLFSLFLDSTDNSSLLLSPYKSSFTVEDFSSPIRNFAREENQNSILLIPGTLLTEFSIYPTPHIVVESGKTRYATIAFAMKSHYYPKQISLSPLPTFFKF